MKPTIVIGLVDDEPGMLRALRRLLVAEGYAVQTFSSADAFLQRHAELPLDCLLLDNAMPGLTGMQLQEHLNRIGSPLPIIFLTGQGDIPTSVRAVKAGAVDFLTKPVNDTELIAAVRRATAEGRRRRMERQDLANERARLSTLTPRELEVLRHVIAGKLNKQIAADLGTSLQTIKVHRMRITEKMGMASVAELVRAAERLGITPAPINKGSSLRGPGGKIEMDGGVKSV